MQRLWFDCDLIFNRRKMKLYVVYCDQIVGVKIGLVDLGVVEQCVVG